MYVFLFFQALFTLFIAGGLFFYANHSKNRSLAIYTLIFAFEILYFIYGTTKIVNVYPCAIGYFYHSAGVLYGPLLWLHFKKTISPEFKLQKKHVLHLVPLLIINVMIFEYTILPAEQKLILGNDTDYFFAKIMPANYFRAAHQLLYAFFLIILVRKHKTTLHANTFFYLSGIGLIFIVGNLVISFLTIFANSWLDFKWYYVFSNLFICTIAFLLYRDPDFFKSIKAKYQSSSLSKAAMKSIQAKLEQLFQSEQSYLNNDLSVDFLAAKLNTKPHYISRTFSEVIRENFNDYVNRHRVAYAQKLLKDENYQHYKIEAIAEEAGFNNKVTFYKAFSKFTETTPSKFRKAHQ